MRREADGPEEFRGLDLNAGRSRVPQGYCRIDTNGDRRRHGGWRVRAGYARLASFGVTELSEVASDNFNRANGSLGANWTTRGSVAHAIATNRARIDSTTAYARSGAEYAGGSFSDDHYSQATLSVRADEWRAGVAVRMSAAGCYLFTPNPPGGVVSHIWRIDFGTGTFAVVAFGESALVAGGEVLRLVATGTTLRGYIDDVLIAEGEDGTYASGRPGIAAQGTAFVSTRGELDDWSGGNALPAVAKVGSAPDRVFAFERDDDAVRLVVSRSGGVEDFSGGTPEWSL